MKRLIALIGVALLLFGIRMYDTGVLRVVDDGVLTVFAESEYKPELFLPTGADCYRIDLYEKTDLSVLFDRIFATVVFSEMEGALVYAYSPNIPQSEWIHGERINIMVYADNHKTVIGVPIIKGSY